VQKGVVVVDAFEGYAYDNGLRIGDRLLSVNSIDVHGKDVEKVRDLLRGEPDTDVSVTYERDDPQNLGIRETTLKRKAIRLSDVRLATFLGDPADGIGYINLAGFNAGAGKDFKTAFLMLKYSALQEGNGLQGLVLDLRGNPGGLLDAAVEIASYLVPKDSEIVTARSRNGPSIIYKSSNDPIRDEDTKIIVLVNENSASASEIVSGAVQDLDAGVIMGSSRTYGKGLVQKIVPLPYESALKYTIAKYYTPSGRCIQSIQYRGGRDDTSLIENAQSIASVSEGFVDNKDEENDNDDNNEGRIIEANDQDKKMTEQDFANTQIRKGTYQDLMDGASSIKDQDRKVFLTTNGRMVKDGGGIEPDIIVPENVLTPTEKIFVGQDLYSKFLKDYLKTHDVHGPLSAQVTAEREARNADLRYNNGVFGDVMARYLVLQTPEGPIRSFKGNNNIAYGKVTKDSLYNDFKVYVQRQVMDKKINLDGYSVDKSISALEDALKDNGVNSKYASALRNEITADVLKNMDKVKDNIIDGLEVALYAREVPDRLLIWRAVTDDQQVIAAADVIREQSNKGNSKQSNKDTLLKKYKLATDGYKFQSVREAEITQLDLENKGFRTVYEQALQRPIENSDTVVLSRSKPTTMEESSNHAAP
jgi:C-terminal peptidase prc